MRPLRPTIDGTNGVHWLESIERFLEHSIVDRAGRVIVPMFDVLAVLQIGLDVDVVLFGYVDGASTAVRVAEVVEHSELFVQLVATGPVGGEQLEWSVVLWSPGHEASAPVVRADTMTFASFVGMS